MSERQVNKNKKQRRRKKLLLVLYVLILVSLLLLCISVYDEKLDKSIVKQVDETNITEFIQASKSTTDLATLQKRFIELGEIPSVDPTLSNNVDTAIMPSDIHSLYNMVNDVNGNFNKLPESVRNVFGNPQAYLAAILDGSVNSKITEAFSPKQNNANETDTKGEE